MKEKYFEIYRFQWYNIISLAYINKLYKALVAVSELTTNSVGGSIHIGKLTPDGFTWLQNGYEL